ncbi:hypothetical protein [Actinokineospora sp. NPDC004072]
MPHVLGVDVGRTSGAVAMCGRDGRPVVVDADVPPLLAVADGEVVVGAPARALPVAAVAADLVDHVGDDVPILLDGIPYTAHDLLATLVAALADRAADGRGGSPDRVAVTHPPDWGPYRRALLHDALAGAGYPGALLLPTVLAAAEAEHSRAPLRPGESVGVALLGGRRVEYALAHRGPTAFELVDHTTLPEPGVGPAALTRAVDAFRAYLAATPPTRAVIAGGAARDPLAAAQAATLPVPTTVPADPATFPARGAALAARPAPAPPSDPALRPVGQPARRAHPAGVPAEVDTVVSHPGFPPVRVPVDAEPPPRPPVEIEPLVAPRRRFARRGGRS